MASITELYDKVSLTLSTTPGLERTLHTELARMVSNAYTQTMGSDEGYCFKFNLPLSTVNKLYKLLDVTIPEVYDGFKKDWGVNAMKNRMYADPYYQILLLITYYGIMEDKKHLYENAWLVALFKIWNGRKSKFIKYCDKRIMKYVVSNMCTNRHLFVKYDSPLSLMKDYYVPTLMKTYTPQIKRSTVGLQKILSQAWGRVHQLFIFNPRLDIKTGKKIAQGGILPLYMKAKQEGLAISGPTVSSSDDEDPSFAEYTTASNRDDIINTTTEYITMNPNPRYNPQLIAFVNRETKVSVKSINAILSSMHNHKHHDLIHDILSIILSRTNVNDKGDICQPGYSALIKKSIISSKNNDDARKMQRLCNRLLVDIFDVSFQRDFFNFSNVQQIQLRSVVILGIVHNLERNICRGQIIK